MNPDPYAQENPEPTSEKPAPGDVGPDDHVMHGPFAVVLAVDLDGAWDISTTLPPLETLRVLNTALHQATRGLS